MNDWVVRTSIGRSGEVYFTADKGDICSSKFVLASTMWGLKRKMRKFDKKAAQAAKFNEER